MFYLFQIKPSSSKTLEGLYRYYCAFRTDDSTVDSRLFASICHFGSSDWFREHINQKFKEKQMDSFKDT